MRRSFLTCAALVLPLANPVHAENPLAPGKWRVTGSVSDHAFTLDCRFDPSPAGFGGSCTEIAAGGGMGRPGKVHALTKGSVAGNRVTWSYPVSVMFLSFEMTFDGTLAGDRIVGSASAAGRKGSFTATR